MRISTIFLSLCLAFNGLLAAQDGVDLRSTQLVATPEVIDSQPALDLALLQTIALANNPSLREAAAQVESARGRWRQAGLWANPTVGYSGQQLGSHGVAEQQGVVVGQELSTGGKLRLNRAALNLEIERFERQYQTQRGRVLTDVTISYYEVLAAQRQIEASEQLVGIGDKVFEAIDRLLRAREVSKIDLLQARIEAQNARLALATAEKRSEGAWRSLTSFVGVGLEPQPLPGTLELEREYTWEESLQNILSASPQLGAAMARAEQARWLYQRARREPIPNLTVQGIVQQDAQIRSTDGAIQITIPVPVFDRNQGSIREAYANITAAEQAVERIRFDLEQRLALVFERYSAAVQQVEIYENQILPASREQLGLVQEAFKAGEINYQSLLFAQRTHFTTVLGQIEALRNRATAASEIEGLLLTGSLSDSPDR